MTWDPDILKYFQYDQFQKKTLIWQVGQLYCDMATNLSKLLPDGLDRDAALHRLLEAKDAALKASMT